MSPTEFMRFCRRKLADFGRAKSIANEAAKIKPFGEALLPIQPPIAILFMPAGIGYDALNRLNFGLDKTDRV
jgi:hypothetical protein